MKPTISAKGFVSAARAHPMSECGRVHGPNWTKWLGHLKDQPDVSGLEIGTFQGDSAVWMLEHIFTHPTARYHCVDLFDEGGSEEHKLVGIDCTLNESIARSRLAKFGHRLGGIVKAESWIALRLAMPSSFDFLYVDGAHDAMNVLRDAVLGFELLKPGGVMVFDDYEWKVMPHPFRPKEAIDAFLNCFQQQLEVLGRGWQVAIRKAVR